MWSLVLSVLSILYVSSFDVPVKIIDALHERIPYGAVPSELAHILCGGMAATALFLNPQKFYVIFKEVYAKGMLVKASLIVFTLMPDANPQCKSIHLTKCLTRNDMLPSGHMLVALCSALVLGKRFYLLSLIAGFLLVASHMHYSVDVILSVWIVYFIEKERTNENDSQAKVVPDPLLKKTRSQKTY